MKTLLITGFEPFGGETINPAWEAVKALPEQIGGWQLRKLQIPTVFGPAAARTLACAAECRPDAVLCIGQAGTRSAVTPEYVGVQPAPRAHSGQPWKSAAGRALSCPAAPPPTPQRSRCAP